MYDDKTYVCSVISVELDVRIIVSEISQPLNYVYFTQDKKQKCLQGGNKYSLAVTDIHNLCDGFKKKKQKKPRLVSLLVVFSYLKMLAEL